MEEIVFTRPEVPHLQLRLKMFKLSIIFVLIFTIGLLVVAYQWCKASQRNSPLGKLLRKCNTSHSGMCWFSLYCMLLTLLRGSILLHFHKGGPLRTS